LVCLHISTHWFLPYLITRIIWQTIRTIYVYGDFHRHTIFPPSIRNTIIIYIIEWIIRITSSCCIIPRFPRIVLYSGKCFCDLTSQVSHIILRFHVEIFPRMLPRVSILYVRCGIKCSTLTLYSTTIGVSYVWTLKNLNSLVRY